MRVVSQTIEPMLINQDSAVSFTVYARDMPGRADTTHGNDATIIWQTLYHDGKQYLTTISEINIQTVN